MTNEQWESYVNEGMHIAAQLLTEEIETHTLEEWIAKYDKVYVMSPVWATYSL